MYAATMFFKKMSSQKFRPCIIYHLDDVSPATHEYRTPISRRWFILCGQCVRSMCSARLVHIDDDYVGYRGGGDCGGAAGKPVRLVVNELHAQLREECRCDLSAATKWVVPSDCGGSQRTVHQSGSEASRQRGWRGLAQLHCSAVVW